MVYLEDEETKDVMCIKKKYKFILEFEKEEDRKKFFLWFYRNSEWRKLNVLLSMYFKGDNCSKSHK